VARYFIRTHPDTSAGIHVRISPFDQRVVDIRLMNAQGMNQTITDERVIERNFFREDFRRAFLQEIGVIQYASNPVEEYAQGFLQHVDTQRIRETQFKLVVDYSHGLTADTFSTILNSLGVDALQLNARMDETKLAMLQSEFKANQERVSKIVRALGADLGVQFDVGGEKIFLVDEQGNTLDDTTTAALMVELGLFANPGRAVAALITLPNAFDTIAAWHGSQLTRIGNHMHRFMISAHDAGIFMAVDGSGNYIFPDFHPTVDGMMATARLLEYLAVRQLPLSKVVNYLPPMYLAKASVPCAWEAKGRMMRIFSERCKERRLEAIDGLKIHLDHGEWVHLSPNPDKPQFELLAEGASNARAVAILDEYQQRFSEILQNHPN
jgi:mannose-1-phosphate guanylyltransferase/phosphomannomutase